MVSVYVGRCDRDAVDDVARHVGAALDALAVARPAQADVLIQPACPWSHPRYAPDACTEPATVEAVGRALDGKTLVLGVQSLPGFPTRYATARAGYVDVVRRLDAREVRFDEAAFRDVPGATIGGSEGTSGTVLAIPSAWNDASFRVSIPRL